MYDITGLVIGLVFGVAIGFGCYAAYTIKSEFEKFRKEEYERTVLKREIKLEVIKEIMPVLTNYVTSKPDLRIRLSESKPSETTTTEE